MPASGTPSVRKTNFELSPNDVAESVFGSDHTGETASTFAKTPHSITKVWAARNTAVQRFGAGTGSADEIRPMVEGVTLTVNLFSAPADDGTIALDGRSLRGSGSDWANAQMFWGMIDDAVTDVITKYNGSVVGSASARGENQVVKVVPRYLATDTHSTETWMSTATSLGVEIRESQPYAVEHVVRSPARRGSAHDSRRSSHSGSDKVTAHAWVRGSQKGGKSSSNNDTTQD